MYQEGHPVQLLGDLLTWQHGATATATARCSGPIATESAAVSTAAATLWKWSGDSKHATTHATYVTDAPDATAFTNAATGSATSTSEHVVVFGSFTRTDAFASYAIQRDDRTSTPTAATATAASKPTPASTTTTAPAAPTSKPSPTAPPAATTINEYEYGRRHDATTNPRQHNVRLSPRQDDAGDNSTAAAATIADIQRVSRRAMDSTRAVRLWC